MTSQYVPDRGDVVWIDLSPAVGHEQAGHRPVLVLSPAHYNKLTDMMLICPITSHSKGYAFEVALPNHHDLRGVVLADQIRSIDWRFRRVKFIAKIPPDIQRAVQKKAVRLIGYET